MDRLDAEVFGKSGGILFNGCYGKEKNRVNAEPMRASSKYERWTCEWQTCEDGASTFIRKVGTTYATQRTYKQEGHRRKFLSVGHCFILISEFESVSQTKSSKKNRDLVACSCMH